MFRLEKLEISGFKSFYDPAELVFPGRMTAVVGPNGCGKSNISDAITWVLGEQRASHIRGGTMEDIIFQGSARRRALGMGEVTLTLASDNGHPAADDGKLVINRRVFKTGETEYRLNGRRVRLKDIADILMDTGLGIRQYAVMEQGKIDLIISNKPQDRRKLIEEAAGITKYKNKRRAAEMKLEETQANLLRIDDTLSEITRNLNSLKRQAAKARRHKEIADALSSAKRSLYAGRVALVRGEQEESERNVSSAQALEGVSTATLGREEADLAQSRTELTEKSAAASTLREEIARLGSDAERLRSFLAQSEDNLRELVQRSASASSQVGEIETEAAEQQSLLDEKSRTLELATAERNRLREVADDLERARQDFADTVRSSEKKLSDSRETLMRTIARISESRNQLHQLQVAVEKCEFYLGKLGDTTRRVSEHRDTARERFDEADQQLRGAEQALVDAQHLATQAAYRRDELTSRRDGMRDSLASSRDIISQTTYRIDSLRTLLQSLETQDEEIRSVILELLPDAQSAAESVRAAEGFESALDILLREVSKAVVVQDTSLAVEAISRLRERGAGRGAFIALDYQASIDERREGNAAEAIIGDGPVADAIRAAVPEAYVVADVASAIEQARQHPRATFVTRDGDIVRGPLILGGQKQSAQPGVFSIKRQVRDLEHLLGEEEMKANTLSGGLQLVETELHEADDARILTEERRRLSEMDLREKSLARERVLSEVDRLEKDLAVASEESQLYEEEKAQLIIRRHEAVEELRQLEALEQNTSRSIRENEEMLQKVRGEFEASTEVASKARVDLETAIGHVNSAAREHENLSRIVLSLGNRGRQLHEEIEQLMSRQTDTEAAVGRARGDLDASLRSLHDLGEKRIVMEAEVSDLEQRVSSLNSRAVAAREEWNARREALFEAERRLDRARSSFELLREQVFLDLHTGLDTLVEVEPPAGEEARAALEAEVARMSDQIEKIGPVNVLAIDEYREHEERESFLRSQRDDLVQSIESLRSTIRKINLTSRELFREAFAAVNQSFREIFMALFGGGHASMQILDEEDMLESGIELIAQPPGKKTQSLSLLSGGERALTALALLFAIFRYKPSPFCILDEVDAPLDEVNNERFVRLVRDMSRETQFIVITHSKRTMEAADVLYGVTMEEAGCSRLVSVSFAELEA